MAQKFLLIQWKQAWLDWENETTNNAENENFSQSSLFCTILMIYLEMAPRPHAHVGLTNTSGVRPSLGGITCNVALTKSVKEDTSV